MGAVGDVTVFEAGVTALDRLALADAQTSGGLLLAVRPDAEATLLDALRREGTPAAAVVGVVTETAGIVVHAGSGVSR